MFRFSERKVVTACPLDAARLRGTDFSGVTSGMEETPDDRCDGAQGARAWGLSAADEPGFLHATRNLRPNVFAGQAMIQDQ
jgi:hypothetical protein